VSGTAEDDETEPGKETIDVEDHDGMQPGGNAKMQAIEKTIAMRNCDSRSGTSG
jgi:hypothetical protein